MYIVPTFYPHDIPGSWSPCGASSLHEDSNVSPFLVQYTKHYIMLALWTFSLAKFSSILTIKIKLENSNFKTINLVDSLDRLVRHFSECCCLSGDGQSVEKNSFTLWHHSHGLWEAPLALPYWMLFVPAKNRRNLWRVPHGAFSSTLS